jgi:hypothetical protein
MEEFADSEVGLIKVQPIHALRRSTDPSTVCSQAWALMLQRYQPGSLSGPSCKEGDFVIVRPNSGTRLKIHGREFRIINDDSVEAVVEDPRGITRAA